MRKPRLHKIFNLPNENGLSNYLIGVDSIDQIIFPTAIQNLSFLPSGPIPPNPAEILGKPEMKILIDSLRSQFDYIVIDNAPTAMVTDGHIVSQLSDLNVFILRYGFSRKHEIEMINQFADKKTIENITIVVNDIKPNAFGMPITSIINTKPTKVAIIPTRRWEKASQKKERKSLIKKPSNTVVAYNLQPFSQLKHGL